MKLIHHNDMNYFATLVPQPYNQYLDDKNALSIESAPANFKAFCCASNTLSPNAVAQSTRPPFVTNLPSCPETPAKKTFCFLTALLGNPLISSPLRVNLWVSLCSQYDT